MPTTDVVLDQRIKTKIKEPSRYRVIIFDDDDTPFNWVVNLLQVVFNYTEPAANEMAAEVDKNGLGVVGIYTYEIAEQKSAEAITLSRSNGFPLDLKVEKE